MGVIKAASGSIGGVMADQWLESYSLDSLPEGILAMRAQKHTSERSANTKGDKDCISDGSLIIVNAGQCALAIDKGEIIGCYSEPGEHTYHNERSKSIFSRGGIKGILRQSFDRFGYGGVAAVYQVIIFLDMRERMGNPFSVKVPINLKNRVEGFSMDASVTLGGMFSFRITDPMVFYKKICGNSAGTVTLKSVLPHITAELEAVLRQSLAEMCGKGVSAYEIGTGANELADKASEIIDEKWAELRGFSIVSIGIDEIDISSRDKNLLQSVELAKALTDASLAAGALVGAQAQAMQDAAKNPHNLK